MFQIWCRWYICLILVVHVVTTTVTRSWDYFIQLSLAAKQFFFCDDKIDEIDWLWWRNTQRRAEAPAAHCAGPWSIAFGVLRRTLSDHLKRSLITLTIRATPQDCGVRDKLRHVKMY